jgi:hypothetical protein
VGLFFIDTDTGQVATQRQLLRAGVLTGDEAPPRPWLRIQGSGDASTMWYAVMRRRERGVYIGALVLRHGDHHTLLSGRGWEEVPVEEIGIADAAEEAARPGTPADGLARGPGRGYAM